MNDTVSEDVKLEPCPFCGGEGRLSLPSLPMAADCTDVVVYCCECSVCGPGILFDQTQQTEDDLPDVAAEAVEAWNTRAYLAATKPPLAGDRWQDISTAPKDGTTILCYFPLDGLGPDWCRVVPVYWNEMDERWDFASRAASGFSRGYEPSHWQSIVAPAASRPKEDSQQ
jgi:hypothetical protein